MPFAWTCIAEPTRHGSFLQDGIEKIQASLPDFRRGFGPLSPLQRRPVRHQRFACPHCCAEGLPGWVRAAEEHEKPEAARIAAGQGAT